jgi:hypothetical protein
MQNLDFQTANVEAVAVAQAVFAILERQRFAMANLGFRYVLQLKGACDVVFVSVGFKDVLDFDAGVFS